MKASAPKSKVLMRKAVTSDELTPGAIGPRLPPNRRSNAQTAPARSDDRITEKPLKILDINSAVAAVKNIATGRAQRRVITRSVMDKLLMLMSNELAVLS
jgi:hypothetical protein